MTTGLVALEEENTGSQEAGRLALRLWGVQGEVGGHAKQRRPLENQLLLELITTPIRDLLGPGEVWPPRKT